LGSGPNGTKNIRNHPFFAGINWDDLYNKKIAPPFRPNVSSDTDTSYFDEEFTRQAPVDSVVENGFLGASVQREFEGFTYTDKGEHLKDTDNIM
jgi:hypothetical protein